MEPQLGVIQQVEGHERHTLVLWCPAHVKIMLTTVETGKEIARAVELRKFELARCCWEVTASSSTIVVPTLPLARWLCGALRFGQSHPARAAGRLALVLQSQVWPSGLEEVAMAPS
jgi:hypothetical protein